MNMKKENDEKGEKKPETNLTVQTNSKGALVPGNLNEMYRMAQYVCKSGLVPRGLDTPEKVLVGLNFLRSLDLPDSSLRQVCVINGAPNIWGDLPLAIVRRSGKLVYLKEKQYDKDYKEISIENKNLNEIPHYSWCEAKRLDTGEVISESYSLEEAKRSGDYDKNHSVWKKHPRDMIRYKPRARVLKALFPDILNGVAIAEYDNHVLPQHGNVEEQLQEKKIKPINLIETFLPEDNPEIIDAEIVEKEEKSTLQTLIESIKTVKSFDEFDLIVNEINKIGSDLTETEAKELQEIVELKHKELKNEKES